MAGGDEAGRASDGGNRNAGWDLEQSWLDGGGVLTLVI